MSANVMAPDCRQNVNQVFENTSGLCLNVRNTSAEALTGANSDCDCMVEGCVTRFPNQDRHSSLEKDDSSGGDEWFRFVVTLISLPFVERAGTRPSGVSNSRVGHNQFSLGRRDRIGKRVLTVLLLLLLKISSVASIVASKPTAKPTRESTMTPSPTTMPTMNPTIVPTTMPSADRLSPVTFVLTNSIQEFAVPPGVTMINAKLYGASGGIYYDSDIGGKGAMISADIPVTPGEVLQVFVGGAGQQGRAGGYNGGGASSYGGSGGGATDIRRSPYTVYDRVLVAGGGGGVGNRCGVITGVEGGADLPSGNDGCSLVGNEGSNGLGGGNVAGGAGSIYCWGKQNGAMGVGGSCNSGGGGGYYGGGAGYYGGSGGGSSFSNFTVMEAAGSAHTGDGYAELRWSIGPSIPPQYPPLQFLPQ